MMIMIGDQINWKRGVVKLKQQEQQRDYAKTEKGKDINSRKITFRLRSMSLNERKNTHKGGDKET